MVQLLKKTDPHRKGCQLTDPVVKVRCLIFVLICLDGVCFGNSYPSPEVIREGFHLDDSVQEVTFPYKSNNGLIVLPFIINDSITVNLILDTGTRNIVLFGKKFYDYFEFQPKDVQFSGNGSGKPVLGRLSLKNRFTLGSLKGNNIPIVVIPHTKVSSAHRHIDGVIGFDLLSRLEAEINPALKTITFRSLTPQNIPPGYVRLPMKVEFTKPLFEAILKVNGITVSTRVMVDTGSELAVILKTSDKRLRSNETEVVGYGFNGRIYGSETLSSSLRTGMVELTDLTTHIIHAPDLNYATIGMNVLQGYSIIINYMGEYFCLKKIS